MCDDDEPLYIHKIPRIATMGRRYEMHIFSLSFFYDVIICFIVLRCIRTSSRVCLFSSLSPSFLLLRKYYLKRVHKKIPKHVYEVRDLRIGHMLNIMDCVSLFFREEIAYQVYFSIKS